MFGLGLAAIDSFGHGEGSSDFARTNSSAPYRRRLLVRRETHDDVAVAAARSAAHPDLCALDRHLDRVFLRADAGPGLAALPSREPVWVFGRADRASDHALADCGGACRAHWPDDLPSAIQPGFWAALGSCCSPWPRRAGVAAGASRVPDVAWRMALAGVGFGLFQSPNNRTMIAAAPRERSGGASGMLGTARLLGQTIGAALVSLLIARFALNEGTRLALLVAACFAVVGAGLSTLRLSKTGARGAEHVRSQGRSANEGRIVENWRPVQIYKLISNFVAKALATRYKQPLSSHPKRGKHHGRAYRLVVTSASRAEDV